MFDNSVEQMTLFIQQQILSAYRVPGPVPGTGSVVSKTVIVPSLTDLAVY